MTTGHTRNAHLAKMMQPLAANLRVKVIYSC